MGKIVLLIDDEELVAKTIGRLLRKEGCEVILCRNGGEALKTIAETEVDLIICDIRMPGMSGVETIKEIRGFLMREGKKPVKEILITGYAEAETMKEALELKVADYIYKPFDIRDFLKSVQKNLTE